MFIFSNKFTMKIYFRTNLIISLFAYSLQLGLISHDTIFPSHNKSVAVELISPETNQ